MTEEQRREASVQFGRALALTSVAANASSSTEDHAIAAMDRAWVAVADAFTPPDVFSKKV